MRAAGSFGHTELLQRSVLGGRRLYIAYANGTTVAQIPPQSFLSEMSGETFC